MANLTDTTNAGLWAEEFCRIFGNMIILSGDLADQTSCVDEGTMLAWFASAIETGRNAGRREMCPHPDWLVVSEEMKVCTTCGLAEYGEPA